MDSHENLTEIQLKAIKRNSFQMKISEVNEPECSSKKK